MSRISTQQSGVLLPSVIILTAAAMVIITGLLTFTTSISSQSSGTVFNQIARSAAQSAIDEGKNAGAQGAIDPNLLTERTLFQTSSYKVTYQLVETGTVGSKKQFKGIGKVYVPASSTTASYTREIKGVVFAVSGGGGTSKLALKYYSTCTSITGKAYCWGYDGYGQIGNGGSNSTTPRLPTALNGKNIIAIDMGGESQYNHTCAIVDDGSLYCWGTNNYGGVGNGNGSHAYTPVLVGGALTGKKVTSIALTRYSTCAVASGTAYCWGYDGYGQIGNGGSTVYTPTAVSGLSGKTITKIVMGGEGSQDHTCAITSDGELYCWGYNGNYGIGNGSSSTVYTAYKVAGALNGKKVTDVSLTLYSTCAVADNRAYCWGYDGYGQIGNGGSSASTPTAVSGLSGVSINSIKMGGEGSYDHTCAISAAGELYCWGYNGNYGVGNGSSSTVYTAYKLGGVLAGKKVTDVSLSRYSTCAVADSAAYCWGYGYYGQLGSGGVDRSTPTAVTGLSGQTIDSIVIGGYSSYEHTCATTNSKALYCWGYNGYGGVGNGSTSQVNTPTLISLP